MACCKSKEMQWCKDEPIAYKDEDGNEYCLFHAPADKKSMSVGEFNERVFEKIRRTPGDELCDLSHTVFPGDIKFSSFSNDHPLPSITFHEATFSGATYFRRATISGGVFFDGAAFNGYTYFFQATIGGNASFTDATFSGVASFGGATIRGDADFSDATYSGDASFREAAFGGATHFTKATIRGDAYFYHATFSRIVDFRGAVFNGLIRFISAVFKQGALFAFISVAKRLQFEDVNLSHVSFLDAEVAPIEFVNCRWPRKRTWFRDRLLPRKDGQNRGRYQVMEEKEQDPPWDKIESLYRKLKHKAKEEHNEPEVSEWHYSEKEIFRRRNLFRRFFGVSFWYGLSSGYGERPTRAAVVLLFLLVAVTLLMGWFGLKTDNPVNGIEIIQRFSDMNWEKWVILVENTLQNALFFKNIRFEPGSPIPWGFIQTFFTRILIPLQFALFAFALRNKFRR